jgi:hypothetical protein
VKQGCEILRAEGVSVQYGGVLALEPLSFSVEE